MWDITTPEAAIAARQQGCAAALRRILGDLADSPGLSAAADLATKAATSAPTEGRVMYAALRTLPLPEEPVARLWHAANMLREHRGDGHVAALVAEHIGGTEAHVLSALAVGIYPAETFGRIHHLPKARLAAVMDGLRARGLVDASGHFTDAGRECKERIEARTDDLATAPYEGLTPSELDQLVADLEPISAALSRRRLEVTAQPSTPCPRSPGVERGVGPDGQGSPKRRRTGGRRRSRRRWSWRGNGAGRRERGCIRFAVDAPTRDDPLLQGARASSRWSDVLLVG